MLTYNTMRFATDTFNPFLRSALLIAKSPFDLTKYTTIKRFVIAGDEPSGTLRRFLFKVDDKLYKFSNKKPVEVTGELDVDLVLDEGNSATTLANLTNITVWAGKQVYPIVALHSEVEDTPSVNLSLELSKGDVVLDFFQDETHGAKALPVRLLGVYDKGAEITGDASADFLIALSDKVDDEEVWTDFMPLSEALGKITRKFTVRFLSHVDAVDGVNCVKRPFVTLKFTQDLNSLFFGDYTDLFSVYKDFGCSLRDCLVVVKHNELVDSAIEAAVAFKKHAVTNIRTLGVPSPDNRTFTLPYDDFEPSSLSVRAEQSTAAFQIDPSNFTFNTMDNSLTLLNDNFDGKILFVQLQHNLSFEDWLPLDLISTQQNFSDGNFTSIFRLHHVPDNSTTAAIRLRLLRPHSAQLITKQFTASGVNQFYQLPNIPMHSYPLCDAPTFSFDAATNRLTFCAPADSTVSISFRWLASQPIVFSFSALFSFA